MIILVSNDDGIQAKGIHLVVEALQGLGDIYVSAPDQEQSAASHSITVNQPLRAKEVEFPGAVKAWAVSGRPADCVKLAIEHNFIEKPDLVISGINHGANIGTDILYSGTVGAAMEGYLCGSSAIAISQCSKKVSMDYGAAFLRRLVEGWLEQADRPRIMLNVNIPPLPAEEIKGFRWTRQGWRWYKNAFEERQDPHGKPYYWLHGDAYDADDDGDTDCSAIAAGYVSVTPLHNDMCDHAALARLAANSFIKE
ncbi:MAG: 5'/3'-nucleotidase SurE [Firmicutes bacterium]|nr:5'/3'-nucleotidase SurE [Bacillota bacterium]